MPSRRYFSIVILGSLASPFLAGFSTIVIMYGIIIHYTVTSCTSSCSTLMGLCISGGNVCGFAIAHYDNVGYTASHLSSVWLCVCVHAMMAAIIALISYVCILQLSPILSMLFTRQTYLYCMLIDLILWRGCPLLFTAWARSIAYCMMTYCIVWLASTLHCMATCRL